MSEHTDHPDVVILRIATDLEHAGWWTMLRHLPDLIAELRAAARDVARMRHTLDETVRNAREEYEAVRSQPNLCEIFNLATASKPKPAQRYPNLRDPWGPPFGGDAA